MKYALVQIRGVYNGTTLKSGPLRYEQATLTQGIPWRILQIAESIEPLQARIDTEEYKDHFLIIQIFNEKEI
jgi:hypothetical protein